MAIPDQEATKLSMAEPDSEAPRTLAVNKQSNPLARALSLMGPGLITGASDDDPSGIATYSTVGAGFGYSALWMAPFSYPLMLAVQYICAKIGMVTGRGLAGVIKEHYPPAVLWSALSLLLIANIINAGADIGAIAAGVHLLVPQIGEIWMILPITIVLTASLIFLSYKTIANVFKWLTLSLFAYVATAFFCHLDAAIVLKDTLAPNFGHSTGYTQALVAILGTTISPYLFFWQANCEVDEFKDAGAKTVKSRQGATRADLKFAAWDVAVGMFFSNCVMYFIILTTAATLHKNGNVHIESASQAAKALEPLLGSGAEILFAAGFIGTGFLAIPVLIGSSSYAIAEALGWPCGFSEKWWKAKRFYSLFAISAFLATAFNYLKINAMDALYWTAILNGVLAPPLLLLVMLISQNKKIMGERINSPLVSVGGWLATIVMTVAAVAMALSLVKH
jgi:NRAMP (natural resistance-associated macrophage protein)-like metal ion transporter